MDSPFPTKGSKGTKIKAVTWHQLKWLSGHTGVPMTVIMWKLVDGEYQRAVRAIRRQAQEQRDAERQN